MLFLYFVISILFIDFLIIITTFISFLFFCISSYHYHLPLYLNFCSLILILYIYFLLFYTTFLLWKSTLFLLRIFSNYLLVFNFFSCFYRFGNSVTDFLFKLLVCDVLVLVNPWQRLLVLSRSGVSLLIYDTNILHFLFSYIFCVSSVPFL